MSDIGNVFLREKEAMGIAEELDAFCLNYVDFNEYHSIIQDRTVFVSGLQYYFLNCDGSLGIENWQMSLWGRLLR